MRLAQSVEALAEGGPKGPPMIAWHELGADEAAAVRADLAKWVDEVLFPLYPSARESVRRVKAITEKCTGIDGHVPGLWRATRWARMATFR
jgi:hypothetical protein